MEINNSELSDNTIIICNIKYSNNALSGASYGKRDKDSLPDSITIDIPKDIRVLESKNEQQFKDAIEQFAYNFVTKRFGFEVSSCQIYLPLN